MESDSNESMHWKFGTYAFLKSVGICGVVDTNTESLGDFGNWRKYEINLKEDFTTVERVLWLWEEDLIPNGTEYWTKREERWSQNEAWKIQDWNIWLAENGDSTVVNSHLWKLRGTDIRVI